MHVDMHFITSFVPVTKMTIVRVLLAVAATCWLVKGLRISGEGELNMYRLKLLLGLLFGGTDSV